MQRAKHRTNEERAHLVKEQRCSGQLPKTWCESRGIKLRTFRSWAHDLERETTEDCNAVSWIAIGVEDINPADGAVSSGVEVSIGRYAVRISPKFDRASFMAVCAALSEIC